VVEDRKKTSPHPSFHGQNFPGFLPMPWLLLLLVSLSASSIRWTEGSYHHHLWKLATNSKDVSHTVEETLMRTFQAETRRILPSGSL